MPQYTYIAKQDDGRTRRGVVDASTEDAAHGILKEQGLVLMSLSERKQSLLGRSFHLFKPVKKDELVAFSRELAVMAHSNLPLTQAFGILQAQTANKHLKVVSSSISDDIASGMRLSQALGKHPEVFSQFFVHMIQAGEVSGKLAEVLEYLATEEERDYATSQNIKGAMIYPLFVIGALIVVGIIMSVFVIPQLLTIVTEAAGTGITLPLPTRMLMGATSFIHAAWPYIIGFMFIAVVVFVMLFRTVSGRAFFDRALLSVPVFGQLFSQLIIIRFTQSLATLLKGGVALPQAIEITAGVVGNAFFEQLLLETKKEVEDGRPLTSVFARSRFVPPMVTEMLTVGETTGSIDTILDELSGFYRRETENGVARLVHTIEPAIIVVLGIGVGLIVAAVLLPLYTTVTQI
ncbi:MAG: type II secretion system F family protein [bacterium]|nr:type II secretion system F family protein [bacterium]